MAELEKIRLTFQVRILISWRYHNDRTFSQLQYTGIVIFTKIGPVFVGFRCCKMCFCTLEFLKQCSWRCPFNEDLRSSRASKALHKAWLYSPRRVWGHRLSVGYVSYTSSVLTANLFEDLFSNLLNITLKRATFIFKKWASIAHPNTHLT